jgi:two-component system, NtrC family, sensor kinase
MIREMKKIACFLPILFFHCLSFAQIRNTDSLRDLIFSAKTDTAKVNALYDLSSYYDSSLFKLDSALFYARQALALSKKIGYRKGEVIELLYNGYLEQFNGRIEEAKHLIYAGLAICENFPSGNVELQIDLLRRLGAIFSNSNPDSAVYWYTKALKLAQENRLPSKEAGLLTGLAFEYLFMGNYPRALKLAIQSMQIGEKLKSDMLILNCYNILGNVYYFLNDARGAIHYYDTAESIRKKMRTVDTIRIATAFYFFKGRAYLKLNVLDSAFLFLNRSFGMSVKTYDIILLSRTFNLLGNMYEKMGEGLTAISYFDRGIIYSLGHGSIISAIQIYNSMALFFFHRQKTDSCIYYANKAIALIRTTGVLLDEPETYRILSDAYKAKRNIDSSFKYMSLMQAAKDSLLGMDKIEEVQSVVFEEQQQKAKEQAAEIAYRNKEQAAELAYKNKVKFISLLAGIALLFIVAGLLWRSTRIKQKSYIALKKQQVETDYQRKKAEQTLEKLQSTQSQLIQSEKMASLGELTAGIAHEIQNPLNFVNNFSEINKELLVEMQEELEKGNIDGTKKLAGNLVENEEKIILHGKRADAIVKGMLQHSRTSTGKKELTDINALADEYLRLSYHGLRSRDKFFNAMLKTDFDPAIGKIGLIPQEFGRVLLNIYNNAFYAVTEKTKQQPENYEPTVSVITKKINGRIEISVRDNGNGISQKIMDKIFQPFFTTKPTGQGTGLGLSMSYDIIKTLGGEIRVDTREGEFTEFVIQIPATNRDQ